MVETTHPGNIGAAARAMKNMGLHRLVLVNPQCALDGPAYARASGADDVLGEASRAESLHQAVSDCSLVVGTSARTRTLVWPGLTPNSLAGKLDEINVASSIQVICYEIFNRYQQSSPSPPVTKSRLESRARAEQLEGFFEHLEQVLVSLQFLDQDNPRQIMKRLRRLYQRAEPSQNEVNILRGILSSVEKYRKR